MRTLETYAISDTAASCDVQVKTKVGVLLVPNSLWSSLPIERQDLHLPMDWNRRWQIANLRIASLIIELSCNREDFSVRPQRIAEFRRGTYLEILSNAELTFEYRHALLYRGRKRIFERG